MCSFSHVFDEPQFPKEGEAEWNDERQELERLKNDLEILILAIIAVAEFKFTAAGVKLYYKLPCRPEKLFSAAWLLSDR